MNSIILCFNEEKVVLLVLWCGETIIILNSVKIINTIITVIKLSQRLFVCILEVVL